MKMYTMTEAAKRLKISRARIHQLIAEHKLRPLRIDGPFGKAGFAYYLSPQQLETLREKVRSK